MPNRLSKLFSRSDDSKATEKDLKRTDSNESASSRAPSYQEAPPNYDGENERENAIHPPDLTAGFSNLKIDTETQQPSELQCIAHLKVLECFYRLRQSVGSTDGLFGIDNKVVTAANVSAHSDAEDGKNLCKLAEKRWAVYVARAVDRFDAWLSKLLPGANPVSVLTLKTEGPRGDVCEPIYGPALLFNKDNMPPVDVLMVWHAYMLNPRAYLEDCLRQGRMRIWHTPFPWQAAVDCINSETFAWETGTAASTVFADMTNLPYDNLAMTASMVVCCPKCSTDNSTPWTTCAASPPVRYFGSDEALGVAVDAMMSSGKGYCDRDFAVLCSNCNIEITHARLAAEKFCSDVERLLSPENVPMGGTVLGVDGIPWKTAGQRDVTTMYITETVNNLLSKGLGGTGKLQAQMSVEGIREELEQAMNDSTYMRIVRSSPSGRLTRTEKIGVRRMMSRYWQNSSHFALDLVGAVIRQGAFVEKMHNIDWLHSPALPSTMRRLIVKYERFVGIMASSETHMAVPTLDVDLAWHTHQLSPYNYMIYTIKMTKQFVDHDDKVAETTLNDSFEWTSKRYQRLYGEPYSECTCWYCEAVRESHTHPVSKLFNTRSNKAINSLVHDTDQDPRKSVHISTHNAVRPEDDLKYKVIANRKVDALQKEYYKACERARKKGTKEPKRNDYYYSDAYGYPLRRDAWRWVPVPRVIVVPGPAGRQLLRAVAVVMVEVDVVRVQAAAPGVQGQAADAVAEVVVVADAAEAGVEEAVEDVVVEGVVEEDARMLKAHQGLMGHTEAWDIPSVSTRCFTIACFLVDPEQLFGYISYSIDRLCLRHNGAFQAEFHSTRQLLRRRTPVIALSP
ncbi:hypothetical protein LTR08_004400 [Meristemomyces frigidus]|nr:hypothetical protein LTR08_004400 [Meristemomyces frigidus]